MSLEDEINKAIAAHAQWKVRLNHAIDSGASEFAPDKVQTDHQCDFGKWLYGPALSVEQKKGPYYEVVRRLHGDFHRCTADIMRLALANKSLEARKLMEIGSDYSKLSGELTRSMAAWRGAAHP